MKTLSETVVDQGGRLARAVARRLPGPEQPRIDRRSRWLPTARRLNHMIPFHCHGRGPCRPRRQSTRYLASPAHAGLLAACWAAYVAIRSSRAPARISYPGHSVTSYPYTVQNASYSASVTAPVVVARTAVDTRSHSGGPIENRSRSMTLLPPPTSRTKLPGQASPWTAQSSLPAGLSAHAAVRSWQRLWSHARSSSARVEASCSRSAIRTKGSRYPSSSSWTGSAWIWRSSSATSTEVPCSCGGSSSQKVTGRPSASRGCGTLAKRTAGTSCCASHRATRTSLRVAAACPARAMRTITRSEGSLQIWFSVSRTGSALPASRPTAAQAISRARRAGADAEVLMQRR
ncbi:hypothetical protein QF027_008239 [Streptomyces canus]|nr:hypothetical protein [Streptomyces canus]